MNLVRRILERVGARPRGPVGPIREGRFIVMDTELTGLDARKDEIVSIGALRMRGLEIEVGGSFHVLTRPSGKLKGTSVLIHGITPSQVADQPPLEVALAAFQDYFGEGAILVGYCLALDLAFLDRGFRRHFKRPFRPHTVDVLSIYGWLKKRLDHPACTIPLGELSLFELCKAFGVPVEGAHSALGDAYMTAQLFQRLLGAAAPLGLDSLQNLLRIGSRDFTGDHLVGPEQRGYY
jgi:DNA polymerase-3 subunit epsilon